MFMHNRLQFTHYMFIIYNMYCVFLDACEPPDQPSSATEFSKFIKKSARPSQSKKAQHHEKARDSRTDPDLKTCQQTSSPLGRSDGGTDHAGSDFPSPNCPLLSPRQREVLYWAANGKSAWVTAKLLGLKEATVKSYMANACARLGADNKTHAVAIAFHHGIIGLFPDTLNR